MFRSRLGLLSFVFLILISFQSYASTQIDPYAGVYKSNHDSLAYLVIRKSSDRYFAKVAFGSVELRIRDEGKFWSKDIDVDAFGQFQDRKDGQYSIMDINLLGENREYHRVNVPEDQIKELMFISETQFSDFSSKKNAACSNDSLTHTGDTAFSNHQHIDLLISEIQKRRVGLKSINSLLIMKDDELLFERYFNGWQYDDSHQVQSVSKSLTSLLAGTAITEGKLTNVQDRVIDLIPAYSQYLEGNKSQLTLEHFLTMSAGLEWDEWTSSYEDPNNIRYKEMHSDDSVAFTLSQPLSYEPGKEFSYSGGYVSVVGEVIRESTKHNRLSDYAIHGPISELCFKNAYWLKQQDQRTNVAGGAFLRPRDMLKIGQLVLNEGKWKDKQIIDPQWLEQSTTPKITSSVANNDYSYFWWNSEFYANGKTYQAIIAQGYGGQDIVIIKDLNLVVVKTASNFSGASLLNRVMLSVLMAIDP